MRITTLGLIALSITVVLAVWSGISRADSPTKGKVYIVKLGDSLWNIVEQQPEYKGQDPRDVVYEVAKVNRLTSPTVQTGQRIKLP